MLLRSGMLEYRRVWLQVCSAKEQMTGRGRGGEHIGILLNGPQSTGVRIQGLLVYLSSRTTAVLRWKNFSRKPLSHYRGNSESGAKF
jgi:hypothetical protein